MAENGPLSGELALVRKAFADIFSGRVLAWQLGGTMIAALCYGVARWLATGSNRGVAFVLTGIGFIVAYVVVCATGCIVARILETSGEEKSEEGVAPLHFLIDNLGSAALLPLVFSGAAVLLAAVACAPAALWYSYFWQSVLVIPAIVLFVGALVVVADLFVLLFIVPAMVVTEQPPVTYAVRRIWRLCWARKMEITKIFGVGLTVAALVVLPVMLAVFAASDVCEWIYRTTASAGQTIGSFAGFVLTLFMAVLVWAPICTVPLAFLNALGLEAYDGLVEGLEAEEEEEAEETPGGGEEVDLPVSEEKPERKKRTRKAEE